MGERKSDHQCCLLFHFIACYQYLKKTKTIGAIQAEWEPGRFVQRDYNS